MTDTRDRVHIFDTTLRDGEQAPGFSMDMEHKLRMARALAALNVDVIEAGFPAASSGDFAAVRAVAGAAADENPAIAIAALARANDADIVKAGEAIAPARRKRIHTFIATSPIHREFKLKLTKSEVVARAVAAVKLAATLSDEVEFSPEDGIRTERDYLIEVIGAALDVPEKAGELKDEVGRALAAAIGDADRPEAEKKRVLFVLSTEGGKINASGTGTAADAIIRMAGGVNAVTAYEGYKQITDEAVGLAAPDVILMMTRGGSHGVDNDALFEMPAIRLTPAAQARAVVRMDGLLLLGFGPRTAEAVRDLNAALYGDEA